jgi:hypothetical protein
MYDNTIMKPIKIVKTKGGREIRKSNRRDEYDKNILYTCMEISQ